MSKVNVIQYAKDLVVESIREVADDDLDDEGLLGTQERHQNAIDLASDFADAVEDMSREEFVEFVRAHRRLAPVPGDYLTALAQEPRSFA